MMYLCNDCDASVGTHLSDSTRPLGTMVDAETGRLRIKCHELFDPHWQNASCRKTRMREKLYGWLAYEMCLDVQDAHFGVLDKNYLKLALHILQLKKDYYPTYDANGSIRWVIKSNKYK